MNKCVIIVYDYASLILKYDNSDSGSCPTATNMMNNLPEEYDADQRHHRHRKSGENVQSDGIVVSSGT